MKSAEDVIVILNSMFKSEYEFYIEQGELTFVSKEGIPMTMSAHNWGNGDFIIVETGDTKETPRTQYEDSGIYYIDDFSNEAEIFSNIVSEIME